MDVYRHFREVETGLSFSIGNIDIFNNMKYSRNKIFVSKCNKQIYRDHYAIKFVRTTYL